jgi:Carboxypeptidase regulatory-like domain
MESNRETRWYSDDVLLHDLEGHMSGMRLRCRVFGLTILFWAMSFANAQSTGGRILGRVLDSTGAAVAGVNVTLVNEATGASRSVQTNATGDYIFVEVPAGSYQLEFERASFKKALKKGITLELNQTISTDIVLQVGDVNTTVEVTAAPELVDTTTTQLGAVENSRSITELPLNARDTYQFLQLQPGVTATSGISGLSATATFYGSGDAGSVSVNGGRGRSNNFMVNGGDANDQFVNLPTVQPSPDSIQAFRVLTNNFDAEYGRNSGSVVNVITKSGANDLHGSVYEYFRNKVLNAKGFFDSEKPDSKQNQFGATFGGPIKKDRTFYFIAYEGRRIRKGISSAQVVVPSGADRPSASQPFVNEPVFPGTVLHDASILNNRPGCDAAVNGGNLIADGTPFTSIFPTNIPLACMDPTSVDLLQFVPTPNVSPTKVQTVPVQPESADQGQVRLDHKLNEHQNLSVYYYVNQHFVSHPFENFQVPGANVPGFGATTNERFQQLNFSHTWLASSASLNEFRFNYNREGQATFQRPNRRSTVQNSCPTAPSWLTNSVACFSDGTPGNTLGIHPGLGPNFEGLPAINLSGTFDIGNDPEGQAPQIGNSFQWTDSFSLIRGRHSMKFGVDEHYYRFDQTLYFDPNGQFLFYGGNAGSAYADYLLGLPSVYIQGSGQTENVRSRSTYLFAQDSWKIKPNLTLNYGLRWELNTPLKDTGNRVQTFRAGQVSTIYTCGGPNTDCTSQNPEGLVFPGDKGVPQGLTQTYYKAFAPRVGLNWSPAWKSGFLSTLTGGPDKTSIRAGWGLFYNPIEQLMLLQFSAEPPFGVSPVLFSTLFDTPYKSQYGGTFLNPVNGIFHQTPGPIDWATFEPITLFGEAERHMRTQYTAQYNLTIQRELGAGTKFQIGYVGSQGHRLLQTHDINYGNPQTCLDLNALGFGCANFLADIPYTIPASFTIPAGFTLHMPYGGPNGGPFTIVGAAGTGTPVSSIAPNGITLVGLRRYSSPLCQPLTGAGCPTTGVPVFGSIFAQDTIGNSAYNSLQASLEKRFARGLQFEAAYTWSKSFDQGSTFEGTLDPLDFKKSRALSLFDTRHRVVLSAYWELPVPQFKGMEGKLLNGWAFSAIVAYQTGFPILLSSQWDNELMNSLDFFYPGLPDQVAPFRTMDPRKNANHLFFDPSIFTNDPTHVSSVTGTSLFGRIGDAPRTVCCGPTLSNVDFSILKAIPVGERKRFEFRAEFFNLFNHAQFISPDGISTDTTFGQVNQAREPREVQFALKFQY